MTAIEFNFHLLSIQPKLTSFALKLTSDKERAKDLTQDTLVKALVYREKFVDKTNFNGWVYTIMKNTFINDYKKHSRSKNIINEEANLFALGTVVETDYMNGESRCSMKHILKEIEKLSSDYRIPFKMHFEGYKYQEIAEKLDLNLGTVKSRIFFARKKLMETISL